MAILPPEMDENGVGGQIWDLARPALRTCSIEYAKS